MAVAPQPPSGHVFRVERKRGPVWYAKYRLPDGRQVQKRIGPAWTARGRPAAGYLTKRLAEDWLRSVLEQARQGTLAGQVKTGATFADAAAEWLRYIEHDRGRKPSTVGGYRVIVRSQLLPAFGEMAIESITTQMIEHWLASAGGSASSRRKSFGLLHGIFRRAEKVWGLPVNPVTEVEKPPLAHGGDIDVFSPEEVHALVRAAASEQDAALYLTAAFPGLRRGADLHRAPHPPVTEIRAAPAIRRRREGPQADLHRHRPRRRADRARELRGEMGAAAAGDRPSPIRSDRSPGSEQVGQFAISRWEPTGEFDGVR